jgi:hypothetical protein
MSVSFNARVLCTIPSGQTNSNVISGSSIHDAASILILAPAVLPESPCKIQVNPDQDAVNGSAGWVDLVDYSNAVTNAPLAATAKWYPELPCAPSMRIVAPGAVAADRVFVLAKTFTE